MFDHLALARASDLHFYSDPESGLKAIIAIHDTRRGPALGGCRFIHYDNEEAAVEDAIRLARGMTYKAVFAGLDQGGGKAVILKPSGKFDRCKLFSAFGRCVDQLAGRYITAIDSGTSAREMDIIQRQTRYVTSTSDALNPSGFTARGVFAGIKASLAFVQPEVPLGMARIAIQGVGNVGGELARMLHQAGARLVLSDINSELVRMLAHQLDAEICSPDDIYDANVDLFAPCGLGAILNQETIPRLKCRVIAGSANNQLATETDGEALAANGILYAPDYIINAGGLIAAALGYHGHSVEQINNRVSVIASSLHDIYQEARIRKQCTSKVADQLAEQRLQQQAGGQAA